MRKDWSKYDTLVDKVCNDFAKVHSDKNAYHWQRLLLTRLINLMMRKNFVALVKPGCGKTFMCVLFAKIVKRVAKVNDWN